MSRNSKGFTLVEIIAVLVILGILASIAVPKFIDIQSQAKIKTAAAEVAEIKTTLNAAWAKYMARTSGYPAPTGAAILTEAGLVANQTIGDSPDDWTVTTSAAGNTVTIGVTARGSDTEYASTGTWSVPQ